MIAVEINDGKIGRIRLYHLKDASLNAVLVELVEPGSIIETDGWTGYSKVNEIGLQRIIAHQGANVGEDLLPQAHRVASLLKRWLLGTFQGAIQPTHLDYYLDGFTFRFNRRTSKSRGKLFYRLLQQAVAIGPVKGSDLIGGKY